MYFLGIDPGLSEVGFGIIQIEKREPCFVDCGIIKTPAGEDFGARLSTIKSDLEEILSLYRYEAVGIEELFFVQNVTNGIKVAHARGVIVETVHRHRLPMIDFKPKEVKSNICGSGSADKKQVQEMIKRLLNLNTLPKPHDAADALAIAILVARVHKS